MSPRPAASRRDASAQLFLDAAASLIDAAMSASDDVPPRLRSIRFPAALEWIRIEDVIRLTEGMPGASKKAFRQRWETRDEFVADAVVHTLQGADRPQDEYAPLIERIGELDVERLGDEIAALAGDLLRFAESSPRSYMMLHLGSVLHRHPHLQAAFTEAWIPQRQPFVAGYLTLLDRIGARFRPGWTPERFDRSLHAMVDGFLLQARIYPQSPGEDQWNHLDQFAETVVAFTLGVLDLDASSTSAREALSAAIGALEPADQRGR